MSSGDHSAQIPCQVHVTHQENAESGDTNCKQSDQSQDSCYDSEWTESVGPQSELSIENSINPFETARSELTLTQTSYGDTTLPGSSIVPDVQLSDVSTLLDSSAVNPVVAHVNIEELRREKLFSYYHSSDQPNWNFGLDNPPFPGVLINDETSPYSPFLSDDDDDLQHEENGNNIAFPKRSLVDENASNADPTPRYSLSAQLSQQRMSRLQSRVSVSGLVFHKKQGGKRKKSIKTYQTEPYEGEGFDWCKGKRTVDSVLNLLLPNMEVYEPGTAKYLVKGITSNVMLKLKKLNPPRYRYICHVTVVQTTGQSIHVVSRQLWHPDTDKVVCVTRICKGYVVVVTLHGIYKE